jgi:voltage-gated potassium channel
MKNFFGERWKLYHHLIFSILILGLFIFGGAFAYHIWEGWSELDSIYFVIMTITTIGYGDFVPLTVVGKIFTMFYAFFGIAMAFYLISVIGSSVFKRQLESSVVSAKRQVSRKKEEEFEERKDRIKAGVKASITRKKNDKRK